MNSIIFPPRPKGAIPPNQLKKYQNGQWVVQYKYNGARNPIHISYDGKVTAWSRYGAAHKLFSLSDKAAQEILSLPGLIKGEEYWLDSECLIKTEAKDTKNKIILFDILHAKKYLFMCNQMKRFELLNQICGYPTQLDPWRKMGYLIPLNTGQLSEEILLAPVFYDDFENHFKEVEEDEVEGLVLRKMNSSLDHFGQKEYEVSWLVRCRREHKNYNF